MKIRHFIKIIKIPTTTIIKVDIEPESLFNFNGALEYSPKPIRKFTIRGFKTKKYLIKFFDEYFKTPEDFLDDFFKNHPRVDTNAFKIRNGKIYKKHSITLITENKEEITTYHDTIEDLLAHSKELINLFGGLDGLYDKNLQSIREFVLNADPESLNNE